MKFLPATRRLRRQPWLIVAIAAFVFALAFSIRSFLPTLERLPFVTLYPAIIITGIVCGLNGGIVVALLSTIFTWYFILPPGWGSYVALAVFIFSWSLLLYLIDLLDHAIDDAIKERDTTVVLFNELQHRAANNMTFLSSLLSLQRRQIATNPEEASAVLESLSYRLNTMSKIHRDLYDPAILDRPLDQHLEQLGKGIIAAAGGSNVALKVEAPAISVDLQTLLVLSRLLAELITNSVKHAFPSNAPGEITISLKQKDEYYVLTVADNGKGPSKEFEKVGHRGMGMRIIKGLATQLDGEISWTHENGTAAILVFPVARFHPANKPAAEAFGQKFRANAAGE